jgi:1-aminocyclopropane-1-carboxylate deaminase
MLFIEKLRPKVDVLEFPLLKEKNIRADIIRLDMIDPVISGNKWFKLKEYVKDALENNKKTILTFGGAFSNHILATAALCRKNNVHSVGIIRGEEPPQNLSDTLIRAKDMGMDLFFAERQNYTRKEIPKIVIEKYPDAYIINEGGYGLPGMRGSKEILNLINTELYTHIVTAVGTGTTLAGLIEASEKHHALMGISVMKNNLELEDQVNHLLSEEHKHKFKLFHQYHFGGYAKYSQQLIDFMNRWHSVTGIPSDFVYTGKMFYAFNHLLEDDFFASQARVLLIHTGGLQGNNSLKKGTLIF